MLLEGALRVEDCIEFFLIFFVAFLGSFSKDYLKLIRLEIGKITFTNVLLSTVTSSFLLFAISPYIEEKFGVRGLMMVSFIGGLLGFEILERISSIKGVIEFIEEVVQIYYNRKPTIRDKEGTDEDKHEDDLFHPH